MYGFCRVRPTVILLLRVPGFFWVPRQFPCCLNRASRQNLRNAPRGVGKLPQGLPVCQPARTWGTALDQGLRHSGCSPGGFTQAMYMCIYIYRYIYILAASTPKSPRKKGTLGNTWEMSPSVQSASSLGYCCYFTFDVSFYAPAASSPSNSVSPRVHHSTLRTALARP